MSCVRVLFISVLGCTWILATAALQTEQSNALGSEGQWRAWKIMHDKSYVNINEDQHRKAIWQDNLKVTPNTNILEPVQALDCFSM